MTLTLAGIEFTEPVGSNRGFTSDEKTEATRFFHVAWEDRFEFVRALLGRISTAGGVVRKYPSQPYVPGSWLVAKSAEFEGLGEPGVDADGVITYGKAKITATYAPIKLTDDDEADEKEKLWAEARADFDLIWVTQPPGCLGWFVDRPGLGKIVEGMRQIPLVIGKIILTRHDLGRVHLFQWREKVGAINATKFRGYPVRSLMIGGFDRKISYYTGGEVRRGPLELTVIYRSEPWDHMFRATIGWDEVRLRNPTKDRIFELVEFRDI